MLVFSMINTQINNKLSRFDLDVCTLKMAVAAVKSPVYYQYAAVQWWPSEAVVAVASAD